MGTRNHVLDGSPDPPEEGALLGGSDDVAFCQITLDTCVISKINVRQFNAIS